MAAPGSTKALGGDAVTVLSRYGVTWNQDELVRSFVTQ